MSHLPPDNSWDKTRPTPVDQDTPDPWSETRPNTINEDPHSWGATSPTPIAPASEKNAAWGEPLRKRRRGCGCALALILPVAALVLIYFLFPSRNNILILGTDSRDPGSYLGRTDTLILTTVQPLQGYTGMLSIPRDLWVTIPGYGENRVNAAHFFAEAEQPGSGPALAMQTIRANFGVDVHYYVRLRFIGFLEVVDALGGVDIVLDSAMSGYTAGEHHLSGEQALALVRDRAGSDDFFRMRRGQIFLQALIKRLLTPSVWPRLPQVFANLSAVVDTDIPRWLWPRLTLALLRGSANGIDARVITREMTFPFTTSGGAQVLAPNWERINPVLLEIFGQ